MKEILRNGWGGLALIMAGLASLLALEWSAGDQSTPGAGINEAYGKVPLSFEANRGQADSQVKYILRSNGYTMLFTDDEAVLLFPNPQPRIVRMGFGGLSQAEGVEMLPGKVNYLLGSDPKRWRANVPIYAKVRYRNIGPGIDLVFYGRDGRMEYDLVVAPHADPKAVKLSFTGAESLKIDPAGDLVLLNDGADLRLKRPVVYQEIEGVRREIEGRYLLKSENQVGFQADDYDAAARSLVIDPVIVYSTYLGGDRADGANAIAVDASGNAYVVGDTFSANFPIGAGAFDSTFGADTDEMKCPNRDGRNDVFVAKLDTTKAGAESLVYSTYLGGESFDYGRGIAVDSAGNAYVTGRTYSTCFPTVGALQPALGSSLSQESDAFIAKLNPAGSELLYSTYLGGVLYDEGSSIAVDASGNAYLTGVTRSINFPTVKPLQPAMLSHFLDSSGAPRSKNSEAFVAKVNAAGTALVYSTYLGGSLYDFGSGIALDPDGNAYVTGTTFSTDFPVTSSAFQAIYKGATPPFAAGDAFVAKLNADGLALSYSTYLGGSGEDESNSIAVDASGNAYVTGSTTSIDFPTVNPVQPARAGSSDAFMAKFSVTGASLLFSTYLGGSDVDNGSGVVIDSAGNAYLTGTTRSRNFPDPNAFQTTLRGPGDVFVTKANAAGTAWVYSSYLGGSLTDFGFSIAVDNSGNVYVAGFSASSDFPRENPWQQRAGGRGDAFLTKITEATACPKGQLRCPGFRPRIQRDNQRIIQEQTK